jgi:uncharacterized protein
MSVWLLTFSTALNWTQSATLTGPSANTLMFFLSSNPVLRFEIGLVAGVFLGAFVASLLGREFKFQGFDGVASMRRGIIGAALMGFGGLLAGGCAIGDGLTRASIFAQTAWLALQFMWIGAMVADYVIDQTHAQVAAA